MSSPRISLRRSDRAKNVVSGWSLRWESFLIKETLFSADILINPLVPLGKATHEEKRARAFVQVPELAARGRRYVGQKHVVGIAAQADCIDANVVGDKHRPQRRA